MEIEQETKDTMQKLVRRVGFGFLMETIMKCSPPRNSLERLEMIKSLTDCLIAAVIWEANWHVENHDGYDCAKRLIDSIPNTFHADLEDQFCKILQLRGKQSPPKSINEQTYESIMKEVKDDG